MQPFGFPHNSGVRVLGVTPDSPAAEAGLRPFALIKSINGQAPRNSETVLAKVTDGETVTLSVVRNRKVIDIQAVLSGQVASKTSFQIKGQMFKNFLLETSLSRPCSS